MLGGDVLLWDCVCDACDRQGRYHRLPQGLRGPVKKPSGPRARWLLLLAAGASIGAWFYFRALLGAMSE